MKHDPAQQAEKIREQLHSLADEKTKLANQYFFKDGLLTYGVSTPVVNGIAKTIVRDIKSWSKKEVFELCELLWRSGYSEDATIATELAYARRKQYEPSDLKTMEQWLRKYVNNWASCDKFCNNAVGSFLRQYPDHLPQLERWTKSKHRWLRRAAAVSLIVPARKGEFPDTILRIATHLLHDTDDLVQKGYGWMLKEAGKHHPKLVFDFIITHKPTMPRVALRYSIEKLPGEMKKKAMIK